MKRVVLLILASIAILLFILQNWVGISSVCEALIGINTLYLPAIIALPFAALFVYSLRWNLLLKSVDIDADLPVIFKYALMGAVFNNLTPMVRFGGEPVKGYMLARDISASKKRVFASLTTDSFITALTLLGLVYFGAVSLAMFNVLDWFSLWIILSVLLLPLSLGGYVLYDKRVLASITKKVSNSISRFWPGAGTELPDDVIKFREDVKNSLKKRGIILKALVLGVLERSLEISCLYVIFLSMGLELGLYSSAMVLGVGILAGMVPLFPGGLVIYESFTILVLGIMGVPVALATSVVLIWRFAGYWLITLVGIGAGWLYGVKFTFKRARGF